MSILREIMEAKRRWVEALSREQTSRRLEETPLYREARRPFAPALSRAGADAVRFLCEIKRASPSAGPIRVEADAVEVAGAYRDAGAAAISLVTEERWFQGRPDDLPKVRSAGMPVLMKDFLVDPWQCAYARALGADAVLLIVAAAELAPLAELREAARARGLDVLVEIHDEAELDLALRLDPELIGINHRDLRTFEVDLERGARLASRLPLDRVRVAESGIRTRADVLRLEAAGFDALLVGEALMRASDPGGALRELRGEARATTERDRRPE